MKAVILAGGLGTRLVEETTTKPKPMVEIGGKPILWHIMKIYSAHGIKEFIICLGYKGYLVKEYFSNYFLHNSDVTFDMANNGTFIHQNTAEPWRVTLVDTGEHTQTGGRIRRVRDYLGDDEHFFMTYGDGVGDVDIGALLAFHQANDHCATITAVHPPRRFGVIKLNHDRVVDFREKPHAEGGWINGGFFVLPRHVIDLIPDDDEPWERTPLRTLISRNELRAFRHDGFWQPMDTLRDKIYLEELWASGNPPWKCW
jgi:glucose-1-phosphate cytidylyltransferase